MFPLLWQYKDEVKTMAQAFFGGVHPNDMKAATNEKAIEQLQAPAQVVIPMSMHFGAPCTPTVSKGDYVKLGQKIGEFKGLGAPIHASVSGTVAAVEPRPYSMGGKVMSVVIDNDFKDDLSEEVHAPADPDALSVEEMVEMVKQAGIVGMGGATFPTHTKISSGIGKVDTVIINGAECEPYITGDHRAMLERTEEIIGGATYLAKMFGVDKVIIGVEDNKQNGIDAMNKVIAEKKAPVVVEPLRCRYPQGGEKQLIQAITGRQVPPGGLPANVGCAVFNTQEEPAYAAIPWSVPGPAMVIHKLAVDPAVQRRGVASALFACCEDLARQQGIASLRIDTYSLNDRMQALIRRQGFTPTGAVHFPINPLPYPCFEKVL